MLTTSRTTRLKRPSGDVEACWVDPGTDQVYPLSYRAYRRDRTLGPDIDHYVWRRGLAQQMAETEVSLTVRSDTPERIRRMIADVLRSIRRGQPAGDAIRHVSRTATILGLRPTSSSTSLIGAVL